MYNVITTVGSEVIFPWKLIVCYTEHFKFNNTKVTHVHYGGCVPDCSWLFSVISVPCKQSRCLASGPLLNSSLNSGSEKSENECTYNVTATITTSVGTGVVTNTFDVTAPLVRDVNWSGDGVVAVGSYKDQGQMIQLADKSNFNKDGLYMNFVVAGNQIYTGILAGIQLACNERVAQYNDGQLWKRAINGIYVLDVGLTNTVLYQDFTVPIGNTGGNVTYEPHDGPGQVWKLPI